MDLKNSSTALFVKDIGASKKFYSGLLGLDIHLDMGKNVIYTCGITLWEIQNTHIIPSKLGLDNITYRRINRFELYFETETIQRDFEHLKNNNIEFLNEIHEEPWGQLTIRFFDPDRHLIEIGESIKQFVTRFHSLGMTVEEINKKTSVPVDEIYRLINET
jgi:catechol 2,3-dioxygenase-like lactoylglutathione lyase family enzyme